jgi:hypothetical protein
VASVKVNPHRGPVFLRCGSTLRINLACALFLSLAACANAPADTRAKSEVTETSGALASQSVVVGGQAYGLLQLTDSTWAAVPANQSAGDAVVGSAAQRAELVRLIEQASGCKVTDIDFARQPAQLDTQVDCSARTWKP